MIDVPFDKYILNMENENYEYKSKIYIWINITYNETYISNFQNS